ncbi:hypothetical protein D915_008759 [Fasciola hepatica]|uniref:Endonuclease/exonuclease/phosphatase domain-containing protein n=1 Tax=Fasciola hepatica TaxID=6192 RepID=A0A4E0RFY1_FASHE|nr:hypothetical protein D915_008759 [Fasciola hepatica]
MRCTESAVLSLRDLFRKAHRADIAILAGDLNATVARLSLSEVGTVFSHVLRPSAFPRWYKLPTLQSPVHLFESAVGSDRPHSYKPQMAALHTRLLLVLEHFSCFQPRTSLHEAVHMFQWASRMHAATTVRFRHASRFIWGIRLTKHAS